MSLGRRRFNGDRTFEKVPRASKDVKAQMRFTRGRGKHEHAQGDTSRLRVQEHVGKPHAQTRFMRAGRGAKILKATRFLRELVKAARRAQKGRVGPWQH